MLTNAENKVIDLISDWHHVLGHLNVKSVMEISKDGWVDELMTAKDGNGFQCEACINEKRKRSPTPANNLRETQPLNSAY